MKFTKALIKKHKNRRNMAVEGFFKQYGILLLAALLLGFYWLLFIAPTYGLEEIILEAGETSFTATFGTVTAIVPNNNDPDLVNLLDGSPSQMTLEVMDAKGEVVTTIVMSGSYIHTNGFNSTDNIAQEGVPFYLNVGDSYTIRYEAFCQNISLENLSFEICGDSHILLVQSLVLCLLTLFALAGWYLSQNRNKEYIGYILLFISISCIFLMSSPKMNEWQEERTAFADAYAASNTILGKEVADENGYVYMEESGLRNMGYLSYSVPLHRFWSDWKNGKVQESGKVSTLYQVSGKKIVPLAWLDGAVIALMRLIQAPYQVIYLSGKLVNWLLGFLFFLLSLRILKDEKTVYDEKNRTRSQNSPAFLFIIMIFMLPSTIQSLLSYQAEGILTAAFLFIVVFFIKKGAFQGEYVLIFVISAIVGIAGIVRIASNGENPITVLINTFLSEADDWCTGLAYTYYAYPDTIKLVAYVLIGILLIFWFLYQRCLSGDKWHWNYMGIAAVLCAAAAIMLSGSLSVSEEDIILNGAQGVLFLPLAVVPVVRVKEKEVYSILNKDDPSMSSINSLWLIMLICSVFMGYECMV